MITKAYKNLKQEATSSCHTLSLETCENVTCESNSLDDAKFYDASSKFEQDKDYGLLQRVSFETPNFLKYEIVVWIPSFAMYVSAILLNFYLIRLDNVNISF